tara:strand:- start:208 stop:1755 length:1548 start_codon:yes stop_codon:yes gene_type:complete
MLKMFESRNRKLTNLIQLGDFLGYAIRENIQLFSVNSLDNQVTYLTESNQLISGNYSIKSNSYVLENIEIKSSDIFTDDERFDEGVSNQISHLLEDLYHDNHTEASDTFSDVIDILTSRTHYNNVHQKLQKKAQVFNSSHNIMESEEFQRFVEIIPDLVEFLGANKEAITKQVPEILNSLKLSESVSNAFAVPKISIEDIDKAKRFEYIDESQKCIYEMICKQELIKKELIEAKESFDLVWASEPVIDNLSSKVFASGEEVEQALSEALKELPYLALVSKKKLFETLSRNLGHSSEHITEKDIKTFASMLFEMKKPAKKQLTDLLSEKYGVNLQYLKESYSFKSLLNTQVVLFESISRIAPKNSVLKQIISEFSSSLKTKNGVQSLDINNIIQQIFQHAEYSKEDIPLMESFSFDEVEKAFQKVEILIEKVETQEKAETEEKDDAKETESAETEEKEKEDKKETEEPAGQVQKEEVAEKEEEDSKRLSDEELMKAIKDLTDIMNGPEAAEDEEEL